MKNIRIIRKYIKETINENILGDDVELSYADHLKKLKDKHGHRIEKRLKKHIYSNNRHGGTSAYKYFNRKSKRYSKEESKQEKMFWRDLPQDGGAAIDDIFHCLPALPYTEDGVDEFINDMISDKIYSELVEDLFKLSRRNRIYEDKIYEIISKTADDITNEWALIYLKKKKVEKDYTAAEDPVQQIIDNLNLESHSEQVKNLVKLYLNQYYEDLLSSPETALEDFKDNLDFYINTTSSVR